MSETLSYHAPTSQLSDNVLLTCLFPVICPQKEVCTWAWDLLTNVFKLDKDRLYVTYFEGKPESGLEPDLETKGIWLSLG